jgi:myo-inositol 2-dehydrogenase / D-chiro-inositol 1-dehydrogenase
MAAAAPLTAPVRALTAETQPGATNTAATTFARKIKLGVIGCGGRGSWIARLFRKHGGYEMHALADYFPARADKLGQQLGVPPANRFATLSGYKRLLESGVEAVALEAPPCFYPEHVRAAVAAGLHVYVAKPVAVDVPGCLAIETAARQAGEKKQCFLVDYQIPTDPHNLEVLKQIRAGAIGKVVALHSFYLAPTRADPPKGATIEDRLQRAWVNDVALGGGYHVNACIHAMDAALWVAGANPLSAVGMSTIGRAGPHGDSHDLFSLTFEFADGLLLNHRGKHLDNLAPVENGCAVYGQTGHALIAYQAQAFIRGPETAYRGSVDNLYEAGAVRNIASFYEKITAGDTTNPTVRRAVDSALATILGREAARRRERLTWQQLLKENQRVEVDLKGLKT